MRCTVRISLPLLLVLLLFAPLPAFPDCPGQPCVTVRFEGRDFDAVYVRKEHRGAPAEIYYYPIVRNGQRVHRDGQPLWGHFARWPAADHPDQSNFRTWHVYPIQEGGVWVDHEVTGVRFEPLDAPNVSAEAAGRALFEEVLRQRQALDAVAGRAQAVAGSAPAGETAPATRRAFDVGTKEQLPPADGRRAYIANRNCHFTARHYPDSARWFPGDTNYGLVDAASVQVPKHLPRPNYGEYYLFTYMLGEVSAVLTGPYPYDLAVKTLERWDREGDCFRGLSVAPYTGHLPARVPAGGILGQD